MNKYFLVALVCTSMGCFSMPSLAQTSSGTSSATASSGALNNAGNSQAIVFSSPGTSEQKINYTGGYSVKSTGAAVLPGFSGSFSSDYCGATAGIAGGGMGFAFSAGAPVIDSSCVMLRTFERSMQAAAAIQPVDPATSRELRAASLEILSEINPKVKAIFQKRNLVPKDEVVVSDRTASFDSR